MVLGLRPEEVFEERAAKRIVAAAVTLDQDADPQVGREGELIGGDRGHVDAEAADIIDLVVHHLAPAPQLVPTAPPEEDEAILDEIHASGADIVWVGLSTPKQERWMAAHAGRLQATAIGVGAAFDFHAGNVSQAPSWMQRAGLEWFYRLIQEPRRLFVRYAVGIPTFVLGIARRRPRLVPRNSITPTATGTPTQEKLQ